MTEAYPHHSAAACLMEGVVATYQSKRDEQQAALWATERELSGFEKMYTDNRATTPLSITTKATWMTYEDGGYIGGFVPDYRYRTSTREATVTTLYTLHLGILATQEKPLETIAALRESSKRSWSDYLNVQLLSVALNGRVIQPARSFYELSTASQLDAATSLHHYLDRVMSNDAYIHVKDHLDERARRQLIDRMARAAILADCQTQDNHFSLTYNVV